MRVLRGSAECIRRLAFSPAGDRVMALEGRPGPFSDTGLSSGVRCWNPGDGDLVAAHGWDSAVAALSPDGQAVAINWSDDQLTDHLAVRATADFALTHSYSFQSRGYGYLTFAPDSRYLWGVFHGDLGRKRLWQYDLARRRSRWFASQPGHVAGLAFHGDLLATFSLQRLDLRRIATDAPVAHWDVECGVSTMAFAPDGTAALATWAYVQLWDTAAGVQRQALVGHQLAVTCLAVSPDGRTLASGSQDRTVRFWDLATGKLTRTFEWPTGPVHALAFAPDGLTAAAGGESGDVVVWDVDE